MNSKKTFALALCSAGIMIGCGDEGRNSAIPNESKLTPAQPPSTTSPSNPLNAVDEREASIKNARSSLTSFDKWIENFKYASDRKPDAIKSVREGAVQLYGTKKALVEQYSYQLEGAEQNYDDKSARLINAQKDLNNLMVVIKKADKSENDIETDLDHLRDQFSSASSSIATKDPQNVGDQQKILQQAKSKMDDAESKIVNLFKFDSNSTPENISEVGSSIQAELADAGVLIDQVHQSDAFQSQMSARLNRVASSLNESLANNFQASDPANEKMLEESQNKIRPLLSRDTDLLEQIRSYGNVKNVDKPNAESFRKSVEKLESDADALQKQLLSLSSRS